MKPLRALAFAFLAASFSISGCAFAPAPRDPFEGLDARPGQTSPFSALTVALIPSPNTLESLKYARRYIALHPLSGVDPEATPEESIRLLKGQFRSVIKAKDLDDARANGADLAVILDIYDLPAEAPHLTTSVDIKTSFVALDGTRIETLEGRGDVSVFRYAVAGTALAAARKKAIAKLDEALRAAQTLRTFAQSRAGAASVPVAAVSVRPAPKTGRSDVDQPGYKEAENSSKFALVIGVENYESLPSADFAERDAQAMRAHLLALGYPERNLIFLTGQRAGKSGIEKYLESWLPRNVDETSEVFFYFSGHGAPDAETGQAYLMPWDGDAQFLDTTGYPLKKLYASLSALKAKRIVVALDSCFSGAGGRSVLAKGARPLLTKVDVGVPSSDRLVVLAAASGDEITGTADDQGHGLFTYYLLKGLNERAGAGSVESLYRFLKPKVQDAARRDNRDQTPQLRPAAGPTLAGRL